MASMAQLMTRMDHSSTRVTFVYQHTAMERDRATADSLGKLAEEALEAEEPKPGNQGT